MVMVKTSRPTKEQKERKEKDPRRAQLEAKLVNPVSLTLFFLILVVSIVIGLVLDKTTEVRAWVVAAVIIGGSLIGLYLMLALKIADQWEKAIVLRLGRFRGLQGPGLFWMVPIIDRISAWIDHRVMVTPFTAERTLTRDTVPVDVDAVLFWLVWDAEKAALEVEDYQAAISWAAQTALREIIGKMDLADILVGRERMDADLQQIIDARTTPWGITVQSVEIRDVVIPEALEDAMSRQAQAERERQARVILGESEKQIADSFRQASLAYLDNPTALHLRAMNMLFEGLQERGALIIVPSSAVETMNLGGIAGLTALAQNAQTMIPKTDSDSPNLEDEKR
jgi:regulator of protease activity HflC (stomatin/prohibitin superfamily)